MEIHLDRIKPEEQYKLVMGLVVPRPIGWVSTVDKAGNHNVAPYSFFNLMSGVPGVVVLGVNHRPGGPKDTYSNIEDTGEFVCNVVSAGLAEAMNLSSLESTSDIDEFDLTGLTAVPSVKVKAPRVKEAPAHLECRLQQLVSITELVRHTLVADVPMLVVIRQPNSGVLELPRWLDSMRVVVAQNPLAIWFMQGQRVTNAMRDVPCDRHPPRFNLDPVAAALV